MSTTHSGLHRRLRFSEKIVTDTMTLLLPSQNILSFFFFLKMFLRFLGFSNLKFMSRYNISGMLI